MANTTYPETNTANNSRSDSLFVSTGTTPGLQPGEPSDRSAAVQFTGGDIQTAINAAANNSTKAVYIHPGTYNQTGVKTVPAGIKLIGDGDSSRLHWPSDAGHQIELKGSGPGLYHLKLTTVGNGRSGTKIMVMLNGCTNTTCHDVTIDQSGASGFLLYGASYVRITTCRILNTLADCIHHTNSTHHTYIAGNFIRNGGDDGIPLIGYSYNASAINQCLIENNDVGWGYYARGLSPQGATNCTYRNNKVVHHYRAGILVSYESAYPVHDTNNIIFDNNTVDQCPFSTAGSHSEFTMYTGGGKISNVSIINNKLSNSAIGPWRIDSSSNITNIHAAGNTYNGAASTPPNAGYSGAGITGCTEVTSALLGGSTIPMPPPHWPGYTGPGS